MPKTKPILDIWSRVDALHVSQAIPTRDEPGFTLAEYSDRYGVSRQGAMYRLTKLVKVGRLETVITMRNNSRTRVYRFKESSA